MSLDILLYVSGLAQTLTTGTSAQPATLPRPVVYRTTCAPHEASSTISAVSLKLGNPHLTSPSGTTSMNQRPRPGGSSPGLTIPRIVREPLFLYAPRDFSIIEARPPSKLPREMESWPIFL